MIIYIFLALNI